MSSPLDLLRFRPLPLLSRIRVGITVLLASRLREGSALEQRPLVPWLRKWSGAAGFDRFWRPQLRAKLGAEYADVSIAFLAATAKRLMRARTSGVGVEHFGYVPGGYASILGRFRTLLEDNGVIIRTNTAVEQVIAGAGAGAGAGIAAATIVVTTTGERMTADDVVLTTSTGAISRLVPALQSAEHAKLRKVRYQGAICVSLLLRRKLTDHYLTYLMSESVLTGVIDMSALVDPAELHARGLVYLPRYQAADDPRFDATDDQIVEEFTANLEAAYRDFDRKEILSSRVARAREVFAIPTLGYSSVQPATKTSVDGVWIITSAQIGQATLNVDESVRVAEHGALEVLAR